MAETTKVIADVEDGHAAECLLNHCLGQRPLPRLLVAEPTLLGDVLEDDDRTLDGALLIPQRRRATS